MSRRVVLSLVLALSAFALTAGLTASLPVASADLGAGGDLVASCHPDTEPDISVSFGVDPSTRDVTAVTLSNVDTACDGQDVTVALLDGASSQSEFSQAGASFPGGTITLTGAASTVSADAVDAVNVVITGISTP